MTYKTLVFHLPLAVALLSSSAASATGITDNFESYAVGSFPSANWLDVGSLHPQAPISPVPSGSVVETTDAFGNPTKAFEPVDAIASSKGIYQIVPVGTLYSLKADMRVDRFSTGAVNTTSDWAMQLTFGSTDANFCCSPQAGIYASSLTHDWRIFVATSATVADIPLGVPITLGTWYTVDSQLDTVTGAIHTEILNTQSGSILVDRTDFIAGREESAAQFNSVAFFGGELSSPDSNLALVDNINVTSAPEPASIGLAGAGLLGLWRMRRRIVSPTGL
jgi:MYXO-CTERM domain-containing protein